MTAVLCFGEVLWDSLPRGLFPGGAPMNVGFHLRQLGREAVVVSAVGQDVLGDELLRRLPGWGLPVECISVLAEKPTGLVRVEVSEAGVPEFKILEGVAWDAIELTAAARRAAGECQAVVFGSLALRSGRNRASLEEVFGLGKAAKRFFDVNLRPPFDDLRAVKEVAQQAHVLKVNHEELARLTGEAVAAEPAGWRKQASRLGRELPVESICVTAGAQGAGLLHEGGWYWSDARQVKVVDTVGAGDAFLAAVIDAWLDGDLPERWLERGCRLAEFVAGREGAMPGREGGEGE